MTNKKIKIKIVVLHGSINLKKIFLFLKRLMGGIFYQSI